MPLLCTGSWRAPKKLCVLTCIQHQRKKPPAITLGRAGRADVADAGGPHQSIVVGLLLVVTGAFILLGILRGCCCFLPNPSSPRGARCITVRAGVRAIQPVGRGKGSCQLLCLHTPWLAVSSAARSLWMQRDRGRGGGLQPWPRQTQQVLS